MEGGTGVWSVPWFASVVKGGDLKKRGGGHFTKSFSKKGLEKRRIGEDDKKVKHKGQTKGKNGTRRKWHEKETDL